MKEEFRPIPDWEESYEISNRGKVFTIEHIIEVARRGVMHTRLIPRRKKKLRTNGIEPFLFADLSRMVDGKRKSKSLYVHRCVAELWLRKPKRLPPRERGGGSGTPYNRPKGFEEIYVEIINGDHTDIRPDNLRWECWIELYAKQIRNGRYIEKQLYKHSSVWKKSLMNKI